MESQGLADDQVSRLIRKSREYFELIGAELSGYVRDLFEDAQKAVKLSRERYHELGVDDICRRCDREDGGSCCGRGIENYFDTALVIANLLAGVSLPEERHDPRSCYFLGKNGCTLVFKHTICVNYLCHKIHETLSPSEIIELQDASGLEIELTFLLHERILNYLRKHGFANYKNPGRNSYFLRQQKSWTYR